ncbi:MAG TPA: sensor histidine kinase [Bacillus sp. (in: firmicutes)]|uniref:sensor histidine kinase n=1 Tax=Bacillus litorisediminis TaxID=2922713 RepID=UPI001FAB75AE|nr:sensor histidine kinase [Bacillus litorisediminis]HWO74559.1 sensor histidine kinase [Bacillus sp. (in: firmicutes)]
MSTIMRHVMMCIGLTLGVMALLTVAIFFYFPLEEWSLLWETKILDMPFITFVPGLCIILAIIVGIFSGLFWRNQLSNVEKGLYLLEQGKQVTLEKPHKVPEIAPIWSRMEGIQKQIAEQTKLSQKLANEKAADQEKVIEEMVFQERQRLARELHDSVSQQLFAASMMMSAITETKSNPEDRETKQLKLVEGMIQQSQMEMRALLLHLRPVALKGKAIHEGMKELLQELSLKVPMEVTWKLEPLQLDKGVEDHLFRIFQESISNTLRHSKAKSLEVLFIERDDLIILRVADDGIGFNVEETKTGSYGLQNMYERAVELGGLCKIVSIPGHGTKLEVRIPKVSKEGDGND